MNQKFRDLSRVYTYILLLGYFALSQFMKEAAYPLFSYSLSTSKASMKIKSFLFLISI
ncbi:hypothetical protein D3C73_1555230 [compost metagenome]